MSVEILTYGALGARLNISPEAARSLAKRLRLPRSLSEDGRALVSIDFAEIRHTPQPPSRPLLDAMKLQQTPSPLEAIDADLKKAEEEILGLLTEVTS